MPISRRNFLATASAATISMGLRVAHAQNVCPFRLAVINDEISDDFDHACHVASQDFGLQWIELRTPWGKPLAQASADQIASATQSLSRYTLKVTDLASPLYKTDFPGAPPSEESP